MQKLRSQILDRHVSKINQWKEGERFAPGTNPVLYLLSGADVTNLVTFYPSASQYLMVALQPAPPFGDLSTMDQGTLNSSLDRLRQTVSDISERNYFRSTVLRSSEKNAGLPGIAPILLTFLAMLDKEVDGYEYVELNSEGIIQADNPQMNKNPHGIRIFFREPGSAMPRTLVYMAWPVMPDFADVINPGGKMLVRLGRYNVILKAAIYLFHEKKYELLARRLTAGADVVIQDDSGVPFRYFEKAQWNFKAYGHYTAAARLTDLGYYPTQTDLKQVFAAEKKALPFAFGYGAWSGRSNLIWAERSVAQKP